ncbi:uncharacterized protein LOC131664028 [Phymastichus coffea]|uniref:uncharacterized protein LOC131663869 n=1 Tax=Phymastichus coffea TaxID=108790 RepID=UPI00273CF48B|nr:uncharacterized protein LOC131663869 [Phymastichus coffea]XP_058790641.1 uncharacterized protein LOC131663899 [Phymastichus coffea]XP_058790846.1 uncharacterized protein LOC131664028 [Phymastichus coffea]
MSGNTEKDILLDEVIIQMVKPNNFIYDKSNDKYYTEFRSQRTQVFETISQAIYQLYEVHITEKEIEARWFYLVKKFKGEKAKKRKYQPSGSERKPEVTWELYNEMSWLDPYLSHELQISSDDVEFITKSEITNKFCRKRKVDDGDDLQKTIDESVKLMKIIQNNVATTTTDRMPEIEPFLKLIASGYSKIPESRKYQCTKEIILYIVEFKKNIE